MKQLLSLLTIILGIGCAPKHNIEVSYEGFSNDTIVISQMPYADYIKSNNVKFKHDTIILKGGTAKANIDLSQAKYIWIDNLQYRHVDQYHGSVGFHPAGKVTLIMDNEDRVKVNITQADGYVLSSVKGSKLNAHISEIDNILRPLHLERDNIGTQINKIVFEQGIPSPEIRQKMLSVGDKIKDISTEFISEHINNKVAAYLLLDIRAKDAVALYKQMDKSVFSGTFRPVEEAITELIETGKIKANAEKLLTVGSIAPNFTLKDLSGGEFTLSSLQGKWVILDFWGTWCGWCIKGFPKLIDYYNKYSEKLEVVAINCIDSDDRWREGVKKHSLPFTNIKDDNKVSAQYAVSLYPTKVIITPEGRIHKVFTGESDDFYKEIDKIMK
ncbi:MAG: TlpA family protein disulfide reductase [Alistipes sp.]|nr:TlpA family protein disulfide reductase [Alistipes sp.]